MIQLTDSPRSRRPLRDGDPCDHPGCLSHISHPCEGCGRIGGRRHEPTLETLIEEARNRPFSEQERHAQRLSFAYGNVKMSNDRVTREMVEEASGKIRKGSNGSDKQ